MNFDVSLVKQWVSISYPRVWDRLRNGLDWYPCALEERQLATSCSVTNFSVTINRENKTSLPVLITYMSAHRVCTRHYCVCKSGYIPHRVLNSSWHGSDWSVSVPCRLVESRWNVMAHGDARERKWRGNWRMEWVASTVQTTSERGVFSIRVQLKCDCSRWRTGEEVRVKRANGVGSQYSSHNLGTWCIQH